MTTALAKEPPMHVVIIGGSGHVGTYLVPRLVEAGHEVTNVSRGQAAPYIPNAAWNAVRQVTLDRAAEEARGEFGAKIRALQPDVVIDMICYTEASCRQLVDALRGHVQHFFHCGTIWVHGHAIEVPTTEDQPRRPFGDYGIRKAAIEAYLLGEARRTGFPATILHPGHIVGVGWEPIGPAGNRDVSVFRKLARGEEVALPHFGMETLHHIHADDIAHLFMQAMRYWSAAVGESFHVVSPAALTLRGFAEAVAGWYGREANLRFLPWAEWKATVSEEFAQQTWEHIARSPNASIAKAQRLLGYQPRYTSLQAIRESVDHLVATGQWQL
jgi:nucleoside-diphosphate-sugar epimerase